MFELPARKGGLGILNATKTNEQQYQTASKATGHLTGALVGKHQWKVTDHLSVFSEARASHDKN